MGVRLIRAACRFFLFFFSFSFSSISDNRLVGGSDFGCQWCWKRYSLSVYSEVNFIVETRILYRLRVLTYHCRAPPRQKSNHGRLYALFCLKETAHRNILMIIHDQTADSASTHPAVCRRGVHVRQASLNLPLPVLLSSPLCCVCLSACATSQHADIAALALLLVDREAKERALALEAESNAARLAVS